MLALGETELNDSFISADKFSTNRDKILKIRSHRMYSRTVSESGTIKHRKMHGYRTPVGMKDNVLGRREQDRALWKRVSGPAGSAACASGSVRRNI